MFAFSSGAPVTQAAQFYEGSAYSRSGAELLYNEDHYLYVAQGQARHLVVYRCADGGAFARKLLRDSPASAAPDFDFVDGRIGYREGVRTDAGARVVYVQKSAGALLASQPLAAEPDGVIDAGFDTYVQAHWDALARQTERVRFLLPSRLAYFDVRLGGAEQIVENGESLRRMRMRLDAWYGFAAPTIELSYTSRDMRLRRFEGVGTIRARNGRNLDVRIEFPDPSREMAQAAIDAALAEPLNAICAD